MTDEELQSFLAWDRNPFSFDQLNEEWKAWVKAVIQSAKVGVGGKGMIQRNDAVLYFCQIVRVFEGLQQGITEDDLRGKVVSGLVLSGFPPQEDASFFFVRALQDAQNRGLVAYEDVGWGREEERFYRLTLTGQRLADSAGIEAEQIKAPETTVSAIAQVAATQPIFNETEIMEPWLIAPNSSSGPDVKLPAGDGKTPAKRRGGDALPAFGNTLGSGPTLEGGILMARSSTVAQVVDAYKAAESLAKTLSALCGIGDSLTAPPKAFVVEAFCMLHRVLLTDVSALVAALPSVLAELTVTAAKNGGGVISACGVSGANAHDVIYRIGDGLVVELSFALGCKAEAEPGGTVLQCRLCESNYLAVHGVLTRLDHGELAHLEGLARQECFLTAERIEKATPICTPFQPPMPDSESLLMPPGLHTLIKMIKNRVTSLGTSADTSHLSETKATEKRGQGDKKGDKKKILLRPLNTEALDCIRIYKQKAKAEKKRPSMKAICKEYAADNSASFDSIYRTVKDHRTEWKGDKKGDKAV